MKPIKTVERIIKAIKANRRFLITSHINPEGDSLGSQLAVSNLLACLEKDFVILDNDKVPARYRFLPNVERIKTKIGKESEGFDVSIVLDCPNLARTGKVKEKVKKSGLIINIDHHVSNEGFGDLNWVEKNVSSVGEMIHTLFKELNCEITKETALYIYIAMLTDTGSFNYSNASSATHEVVSELLGYGIEPYDVSKSIYENKTPGEIKLLARALSSMKFASNKKIAYMVIRRKLLGDTKTTASSCENFVNFARSVKGVLVAVLFREDTRKKNVFHVSFRSMKDADVNRIARAFGGGGHKSASGCVLRGNFETVRQRVLKRIKDEL